MKLVDGRPNCFGAPSLRVLYLHTFPLNNLLYFYTKEIAATFPHHVVAIISKVPYTDEAAIEQSVSSVCDI